MLARAFSILLISFAAFGGTAAMAATDDAPPPETPPPSTFNVFYPEERALSDCLSSLPKPNCGSDARGGWAQYSIAVAIVAGLGFIGWRIVRSARRTDVPRTPDATSVPDGGGGDPAP